MPMPKINRRADERYSRQEALSLTIIFTSQNPGLLGKTLKGSTIDISASGLRIVLGTAIPPAVPLICQLPSKMIPINSFYPVRYAGARR